MSVELKIIIGTEDPDFNEYADVFYNNFTVDDWDWMIIGTDEKMVIEIAEKFAICYHLSFTQNGKTYAVTYHL